MRSLLLIAGGVAIGLCAATGVLVGLPLLIVGGVWAGLEAWDLFDYYRLGKWIKEGEEGSQPPGRKPILDEFYL